MSDTETEDVVDGDALGDVDALAHPDEDCVVVSDAVTDRVALCVADTERENVDVTELVVETDA